MKRKMKLSPLELSQLYPQPITDEIATSLKSGDLVVSMSSTTRTSWVRVVDEVYYDSGGKASFIKLTPVKKLAKSVRRGKNGFRHWGLIRRVDLDQLSSTKSSENELEDKVDILLREVKVLKALLVAENPSLLPRLADIERTVVS